MCAVINVERCDGNRLRSTATKECENADGSVDAIGFFEGTKRSTRGQRAEVHFPEDPVKLELCLATSCRHPTWPSKEVMVQVQEDAFVGHAKIPLSCTDVPAQASE